MSDQNAESSAEGQAQQPTPTPPPVTEAAPAPEAGTPAGSEEAPAAVAEASEEAPAAAAEAAEPEVITAVETTGSCSRLVKIQVPQAMVDEEIEKSYEELRKSVFIKGFRRAHIPRHVLVQRFGEQVRESVGRSLVDGKFQAAVEEHSLRLAFPPTINYDEIAVEPGKPLAFDIKVEVTPEFTIDNYKGIEVERPAVQVTEQDTAQALEGFRLRRGEYRKVEEGEVREGDLPVCHALAIQGGNEIWRESGLGISLASDTVAGMTVPGLRDALVGARLGETKTFHVTLPDDFRAEEHRGKEVDLEITLDELRRFEAPEATDEWAKSLHFDGLEDLREELVDELGRHREQEADDVVQRRIAERLLQLTDFDVPEGLVGRLVERAGERQRLELLYRGVPREQLDKAIDDQAKQTRDSSVRQCKLYFIYEKIAEQEKIFVTEDELEQRIQAIALNYRRRPEEVKAELETQGRIASLRQQMREEKVRDFLVQHAGLTQAAQAPAKAAPAAAPEPPPQEQAPGEGKGQGAGS